MAGGRTALSSSAAPGLWRFCHLFPTWPVPGPSCWSIAESSVPLCLSPLTAQTQGEEGAAFRNGGISQSPWSPYLPEPLVLEIQPGHVFINNLVAGGAPLAGEASLTRIIPVLATTASCPAKPSTPRLCPLALLFVLLCTDLKWIPSRVPAAGRTAVGTCGDNGCAHL